MSIILRVDGFYNKAIFLLGSHKETNIYYIIVDDHDDILAGIMIKQLLIHNTVSNTVVPYELPFPAENFTNPLCCGAFYYIRFSHDRGLAMLHIHRTTFDPIQPTQIAMPLTEFFGTESAVYRTEMKGMDDRYCLVGLSTSTTYETTHMLLIDFEEQTWKRIELDFGIDSLSRIETIMAIKDKEVSIFAPRFVLAEGCYKLPNELENLELKVTVVGSAAR